MRTASIDIYCCGPSLIPGLAPAGKMRYVINDAILGPYQGDSWAMLDAEPFLGVHEKVSRKKWETLRDHYNIITDKTWKQKVISKGGQELLEGWQFSTPLKPIAGSTVVSLLTFLVKNLRGELFTDVRLYGCDMAGRQYHSDRRMLNPDWWINNRWTRERKAVADCFRGLKKRGVRPMRIRPEVAHAG